MSLAVKRSILFVIDDINYESGMRQAVITQINALQRDYEITLFSTTALKNKDIHVENNVKIVSASGFIKEKPYLLHSVRKVIVGRYPLLHKIRSIVFFFLKTMKLHENVISHFINDITKEQFETYDNVVVLSENSIFRKYVSMLKNPKKIQWLHTDYERWRNFNIWTKFLTRSDCKLYQKFDAIVSVSEKCKEGFVREFPQLEEKAIVIRNLVQTDTIRQLAKMNCPEVKISTDCFNIVTIGRFSPEKNHKGLLYMAWKLKQSSVHFRWFFVGDGELAQTIKIIRNRMGLEDTVVMLGYLKNPYPVLLKMDLMVLFSLYEATPITIDESMVLGVPVMSKQIGGIAEQIQNGKNGILVNGNENEGFEVIKKLIEDKKTLMQIRENLSEMDFCRTDDINKLNKLFMKDVNYD